MQNANKHIYATKKTINELAKINEYLGMELKLDDSRTRGDRSKKTLPVMVDDAIALRDKLGLAIGKVKQENRRDRAQYYENVKPMARAPDVTIQRQLRRE